MKIVAMFQTCLSCHNKEVKFLLFCCLLLRSPALVRAAQNEEFFSKAGSLVILGLCWLQNVYSFIFSKFKEILGVPHGPPKYRVASLYIKMST